MHSNITELWLPVVGFEEFYEVSNFGNVKSIYNPTRFRPKQKPITLSKGKNIDGYYVVVLSVNGNRYCKRVNRLVAQAFIPNPNNKPCVNHIDGIKDNDFVDNLEWATYSENEIHSYKKLGKSIKGNKKTFANNINPKAKPILCIEKNIIFKSVKDAAQSLGVQRSNINKQLKSEIKKCGGYSFKFV